MMMMRIELFLSCISSCDWIRSRQSWGRKGSKDTVRAGRPRQEQDLMMRLVEQTESHVVVGLFLLCRMG